MGQSGERQAPWARWNHGNRAYESSSVVSGERMEQGRWLDRLMQQCHGVSGLLDRVFCWVLGARIIGGGILFPLHGYLAVIVA
jgi:hypothetical protein